MTRPLVLIHGFTGTAASFARVAALLPEPPHYLSPLGHRGLAEAEARVTTWAHELERLVSLLPAEPVHLAGYSLGARLALGIALAFPGRVAGLTLISGHTGLATHSEREVRRRIDMQWRWLLETQGIARFVNEWEQQPIFATQARLPASLREAHRAERLSHEAAGLARSLRVTGLAQMPNYTRQLGSLALPVTVIAGELDSKFTELGRTACEHLPNGRFVAAPDAGHDLLLERPDLVALVLREETQKAHPS
ncbi:MAG TPA: alpha/beta fold hydrolase [Polyangiaceae bacterium]|jgi:2-succinyl-6-hydroxy-2,4-cyclohexadiene-1-carboxylate synthase|nr:alpha/beta fold hydrolase [Polyangiaceae bacterium]